MTRLTMFPVSPDAGAAGVTLTGHAAHRQGHTRGSIDRQQTDATASAEAANVGLLIGPGGRTPGQQTAATGGAVHPGDAAPDAARAPRTGAIA